MIYDLNTYRHTIKPIVKTWCDGRLEVAPIEHLNALTQMTSCDIIIVAYYIGELYGFTPEVLAAIDSLTKFYKPDEIIGKEGIQ